MVTYNFKGSSSCDYCNDPITLRGNRWKNDKSNGLFALRVIALVVFLICLGLMIMFKWTKANGARDRLRSVGYFIATASGIIYLIFEISDTALKERRTRTIYLYYLTYIFSNLFWRIYDILIIATILRTVSSFTTSKLTIPNIIAIVILSLVTTAGMGMYAAEIGYLFTSDYVNLEMSYSRLGLSYSVLYFAVVIYAGIVGILGFVKERSKAAALTIGVIIPAIFISSLLSLAYAANTYAIYEKIEKDYYYDAPKSAIDLSWANSYIYVLAMVVINLGLAIVGCLKPKVVAHGGPLDQQKNGGYMAQNPGYQAYNSGYGQPGPGYGPPTTVYGQPNPGYGPPNPGYGQPGPGYGPPIEVPAHN